MQQFSYHRWIKGWIIAKDLRTGLTEEIITEISNPNVDLDKLVEKVELGYELIGKMKDRLSETKEKIEELHKKYEDVSEEA